MTSIHEDPEYRYENLLGKYAEMVDELEAKDGLFLCSQAEIVDAFLCLYQQLDDLVEGLEEEIPGILKEYESNGVDGLPSMVISWATDDAYEDLREDNEDIQIRDTQEEILKDVRDIKRMLRTQDELD